MMLKRANKSTRGSTSRDTGRVAAGLTGLGLVTIVCVVMGGAHPLLFQPVL